MSRFNHSICNACWAFQRGEDTPHRLREPETETCCYCGSEHESGIYVREDPRLVPCGGEHRARLG